MNGDLKTRARHRWRSILTALGVPDRALVNKHGPCPLCERNGSKGGKDRWRFDDKDGDGTWYCNQCRSGDGIALVMLWFGVDFQEALKKIEECPGMSGPVQISDNRTSAADRDKLREVWNLGRRVTPETVAGKYLTARTGLAAFSTELRAVSGLRYYAKDSKLYTTHPALVALVRGVDGETVQVHRTYLSLIPGKKADVESPRKLMRGLLPPGSAVRLGPVGETLGIAEGIETALSVMAMFGVPCWAALTARNLERWTPPAGVKVVVYADHDDNFVGQQSAFALAKRLRLGGGSADVQIPEITGDDWNDVLQRSLPELQPA